MKWGSAVAGSAAAAAGGGSTAEGPAAAAAVRVCWGATGKSVLATQAVAAGTTLWRESPVAAIQDRSSQRHGAMACRHSLRCVGTMPEQLSVLGRFTEVEQAAGAATIAPELAELMGRAQASARLSGGFVQHGNELFSDAAARDQASVAYNSWLNADPTACASFLATPWTTARRGLMHCLVGLC